MTIRTRPTHRVLQNVVARTRKLPVKVVSKNWVLDRAFDEELGQVGLHRTVVNMLKLQTLNEL